MELAPIADGDIGDVAVFLDAHLNHRLGVDGWRRAIVPPWRSTEPHHGYLLRAEGEVVGAYVAFYSERKVQGRTERFCNVSAWCVREDHRAQSVRLVRAMLRQRDYHFVDLSPSGNVVALNERLGFERLDTTTAMVPNLPLPTRPGVRLLTDPDRIEAALAGEDLIIFRDHRRAAAAVHMVVNVGGESCYVVARKERRRGLPVFASVLHVSRPDVLRRAGYAPYRHLLIRHGALVTLAELRVVGTAPRLSRRQRAPRPRMFRSEALHARSIDYLYSELACVPW